MRDSRTSLPARLTPPDEGEWDRYLAGECGEDERQAIETWLREHPDHALAVGRMAYLASYPTEGMRQTTTAQVFESFQQKRGVAGEPRSLLEGRAKPQPLRERFGFRKLSVPAWGAVATSVVVGTVLLWLGMPARNLRQGVSARSALQTVATPNGHRLTLALADGSRILLNAGSRLRFPHDLRNSREVELEGEAMFMVNRRSTTPFIVQVGTARVKVLGTTFVVRRYPEDHSTRVVVTEGRVQLLSGSSPTTPARYATLSARMLGEIPDSTQTIAVASDVDLLTYTDWTRDRLIFHGIPLRKVFPELERRYGLQISVVTPAIMDLRLRATITDAPVRDVLDLIAMTFGMRYTRHANVVTFFWPPAPARRIDQQSLSPEARYGR